MTLGQRIQTMRKEKGLSQEALGEALGVSRQTVSQWECGGSAPELDKLTALGRLFGVSLGWLLQGEEDAGEAPGPAGPEALRAERARLSRSRGLGHGLAAVAALALVMVIALLWVRLDRAEARLIALEAAAAAPALDAAAPLAAAFDMDADRDGPDAVFTLSLTAAQQVEGMTVTFQLIAPDGSLWSAEAERTGTTYRAALRAQDYGNSGTLTAVFDAGGRQYTQALARNIGVGEYSVSWEPLWTPTGG